MQYMSISEKVNISMSILAHTWQAISNVYLNYIQDHFFQFKECQHLIKSVKSRTDTMQVLPLFHIFSIHNHNLNCLKKKIRSDNLVVVGNTSK